MIYHNGKDAQHNLEVTRPYQPNDGSGRIAEGRRFSESNEKYASVEVDELLFFNEVLNEMEIAMLVQYMT